MYNLSYLLLHAGDPSCGSARTVIANVLQ